MPYKKQLQIYFENWYPMSEPILMVTDVMNAAQYGLIVPSGEFEEALQSYYGDNLDADIQELVSYQSVLLKNL